MRAGVSDEDLEALGLGDLAGLDQRSRAAIVFAVDRSTATFPGAVGAPCQEPDVDAAMEQHFTPEQVRQVDATARGITFANLSVGTAEALQQRFAR